MDESCKQLIGEVGTPILYKPGQPARLDDEYVRNCAAQIFWKLNPWPNVLKFITHRNMVVGSIWQKLSSVL